MPKKAKPSSGPGRALSQRKRGGLGISPDYGNPTPTRAEEGKAERSGQAKRGEQGGFRVSPGC
jgi:hypothetical protein